MWKGNENVECQQSEPIRRTIESNPSPSTSRNEPLGCISSHAMIRGFVGPMSCAGLPLVFEQADVLATEGVSHGDESAAESQDRAPDRKGDRRRNAGL